MSIAKVLLVMGLASGVGWLCVGGDALVIIANIYFSASIILTKLEGRR